MPHFHAYDKCCSSLREKNLYRTLPLSPKDSVSSPIIADFSHNDYLGLSRHPLLIQRAQEYAEIYGVGSKSSRILQQDQDIYFALEQKIAFTKKTDSALIFNSGYQANATVLSALLDKTILGADPLVFTDRLIHASLHHGIHLAGARQIRYRHLDMTHLEALLKKQESQPNPKFIVTESVFGMDGDVTNLAVLTQLAAKYGAFVYVDEAHATGMFGEGGYGMTSGHAAGIQVSMGTFSKAIGVSGAYIACSQRIRDYLVNRCSGFIYSTAPSPMVIGAVDAAWDLLPSLDKERGSILVNTEDFRLQLRQKGYDTLGSTTHIVPILMGDSDVCLAAQRKLKEQGILVSAIRPPTVPTGTARLRLGIGVDHTGEILSVVVKALPLFQVKTPS